MSKYIPVQSRVSGVFPVVVNGVPTYLAVGSVFNDTPALLGALDDSGISYTDPPSSGANGTATGRIRIVTTGGGYTVGVNGDLQYIPANAWFTPNNSQLQVILASSGLNIEVEYTTSVANPNLLTNGSFDNGGTGIGTPGTDYVNFSGGQAFINDQFGDLGPNNTGLLWTGVTITNTHYDVTVNMSARTRGSYYVVLGGTTVAGPVTATGPQTFTNLTAGGAGTNCNIAFATNSLLTIDEVILVLH